MAAFRDLTMFYYKRVEIIAECSEDFRDRYWYWLKKVNIGCFDFFSDLVFYEDEVQGVRIESRHTHHLWSVVIDRIVPNNLLYIKNSVDFFLF